MIKSLKADPNLINHSLLIICATTKNRLHTILSSRLFNIAAFDTRILRDYIIHTMFFPYVLSATAIYTIHIRTHMKYVCENLIE